MGQARRNRLKVVEVSSDGGPVVIALGDKSADRLNALFYAKEAARAAAGAALQVAQKMEADWSAAMNGIVEVHGIEVGEETKIRHDVAKRTITVERSPNPPPDPPPDPA